MNKWMMTVIIHPVPFIKCVRDLSLQ